MPTIKPNKANEIIDKIFKDPSLRFGLKEFEGMIFEEILYISKGDENRYFVKDLKSGNNKFVFDESTQNGKPEEIVRQLWLYKLNKHYKYQLDRIDTEKSIHFGREIHAKAADIIIYKEDKVTPYIIIEVKSPTEEKGIDQLKSYLNAEGCEIGVWSNGIDRVILYRNYPNNFEDTLSEIPTSNKTIDDLLSEKRTLADTNPKADLKRIIEITEELVLANAGVDVFNETFKLIYAKLYDEQEAENREDQEVFFRKYKDPQKTFSSINSLFRNAIHKWPGIFFDQEVIRLTPEHLNVVVGEMEKVRLFGSDLSIIDEAFEYLIPEVAKSKKGQYFTPRHVINMAIKILNPKQSEYVLDPAAGSGGFLVSTMAWVMDQYLKNNKLRQEYAKEYLYGIDFADETAKVSRALMLIAGDGRSHLFKLNSLDAREWQGEDEDKLHARLELKKRLVKYKDYSEEESNQKTFKNFDFDIVLTNPPFAGELKDPGLLRQYEFGKKNGELIRKIERHILFIERNLQFVKPGGRLAIVLPQGVLNNTNMKYVREWLFDKARILAVVGLHVNTFKPHTGTKTSILFLQKWNNDKELLKDYPIFMAVSKRSGKDNGGEYIYKKGENGKPVFDFRGKKVMDHDLDEIADKFIEFAKKEGFEFWK
ncbi:MAG: Type I Restriction Enzyme [Candidatus Woesebacteria bacterium GW2011_GWA1_33_30]|uniref:Type I Restriction Enzyme n=1 Tax=Candidatus Woesebacteria bacterium GW2011_GWA2_33_28 TaxID=1618561 RepID=A0A0F9ZRJ7_9BACT|nr:MAG: Type I Restriction Enzyme [Candidatus Woesebacteria bacterium GW2011_GWA2_33_28]KKP47581.1 MAG: Type I Restriction Enzyme [Candidatus Woesebacteria bacterium GW2011_GWA1_33_30]KKP49202.1 MAG: Type I Restriction Enzyme [Microgenomates group bacterium GW2011_GWC1_33_32]KKP51694.1 MAG: Type I Restriction Enzyme [Candidatus Woesebacteria bacterium GW2011_GWB1_33_38]KKP58475.1 MAG: Type I Restriction Enzyme [Microgenomates group bacterium GW2011_GWD1_33_9]